MCCECRLDWKAAAGLYVDAHSSHTKAKLNLSASIGWDEYLLHRGDKSRVSLFVFEMSLWPAFAPIYCKALEKKYIFLNWILTLSNWIQQGHTIFCQSSNHSNYSTSAISVFVLLSWLFSLVWCGWERTRNWVGKRWYHTFLCTKHSWAKQHY